MSLDGLDLLSLGEWQRFESMCYRLVSQEHDGIRPIGGPSEGGRDIIMVSLEQKLLGAWQAKFFRKLDADARKSTKKSLEDWRQFLDRNPFEVAPNACWTLCIPIKLTPSFSDWLDREAARLGVAVAVWPREKIIGLLENHPTTLHSYFFGLYAAITEGFRTEELELLRFELADCSWRQPDPKVLLFGSDGTESPDLVLDAIVRNVGTIDTVLLELQSSVGELMWDPHGEPNPGLLHPEVEYAVSVHGGEPGKYSARCDPPLVIKAGAVSRLRVRVTDTGYAARYSVQLLFSYGRTKLFPLPAIRLAT